MQLKFDEDGKVVDSCFKAYGCGSAIATTSYSTEIVKGKSVEEALGIKNKDLAKQLNLPPIKHHCSSLAEQAIKLAVNDWQKKSKVDP